MIKKIYHIADLHIRTFKFHDEYKEQFQKFIASVKENISKFEESIKSKYDNSKISYFENRVIT